MRKIDRELLFFNATNSRLKLKEVAGWLRKSPPRLKYNLRHLEKEKVLFNPLLVVDYSFFGLLLFRVYFKGGYVADKDKSQILARLQECPYVVSIYELAGEFDLVLEMETPNASRFNKELKKIIQEFPTLNNYKIVLNIVTRTYPPLYLLADGSLAERAGVEKEIIVGGDRQVEQFEPEEMAIIQALLVKPNLHYTKLARLCKINVKTAVSLLKRLRKRTIIKGFSSLINTHTLGICKHRLFLKLHNLSPEREQALINYFTNTPEIVQINKTVGDWDLEVDLESFEKKRIREIVMALREGFIDLIETFNSMEFFQYYKKSLLPQALFVQEEKVGKKHLAIDNLLG